MAAALILAAGFTLAFARSMTALSLAFCLVWLIGLVALVWLAVVLRLVPPPATSEPSWRQAPGLVRTAVLFAGASLAWMVVARMAGQGSLVQTIHWPVQMVLLLSMAGLVGWQLVRQKSDSAQDQDMIQQAGEQRERLVAGISRLSDSPWLASGEPLTSTGRLRTTLRWWGEELVEVLPASGPALLRPPHDRILYESDRLLGALREMGRVNEQDERRLGEAEIEILTALEAIELLTQK